MKHILLIEDNLEISNFYKMILEDAGYEISTVDSLQQLHVFFEEKPGVDFVFLDVMLGDEEARDVLPVLKGYVSCPVVIVSNMSSQKKDYLQLGVEDFLVKSEIEPEELVEVVKRRLGR